MDIIKKNEKEFDLNIDFFINFVDLKIKEEEHTHNFIEIVYTLNGKGVHIIDGKEYRVKGGDILVINYHCKHEVIPGENLKYFDVMFKPEYISNTLKGTEDVFLLLRLNDFVDLSTDIIKSNLLMSFDENERIKMEFLINWIRDEQDSCAPGGSLVMHSALSMLLTMMFRKMAQNQNIKLSVNEYILDYFKKNCCNHLLIIEVASKCGYSTEHFSRIFKKYTGISPVSYLMDCRINVAKELLVKTDKSIESIMYECGFTNRTAFFKKFNEIVGCTPLQYRKNQK